MPREDIIITREIAPLPERSPHAHKGNVGRIVIIGGCYNAVVMVGAPAMAANAAFRSGAGLVQLLVPEPIRTAAAGLAPCATVGTLQDTAADILEAVSAFHADVVALGPGLGHTLGPSVVAEILIGFSGPMVVDADGLNLLAAADPFEIPQANRIVLTPHPGEMRRLLDARGRKEPVTNDAATRRAAACALVETYGCNVALKGPGTVVTNGDRMYINETGNAGMATGGAGDVLTGVIAALLGQGTPSLEAAILGVYLHGLAGDFAAEELGRRSMTAGDIIEYLPEAICEYEMTNEE